MSQTKAQLLGPVLGDVNYDSGTLFVDSTNNIVGIGTNSPISYNQEANNLVIADTGNCGITIAAGSTNASSIYFADGTDGTQQYQGIIYYDHLADKLNFHTNYSGSSEPRMVIDSNGNVGIGTTNPSNLLSLYQSGGPVIRLTEADNGSFSLISNAGGNLVFSADHGNTASGTSISFGVDGNQTKLFISELGNIGIGTDNPTSKLQVHGDSGSSYFVFRGGSAAGGYGGFINSSGTTIGYLGNGGGGAISDGTVDNFVIRSEADLIIATGGNAEKIRLTSGGNVGIGTNNPSSSKLHLYGGAGESHQLKIERGGTGAGVFDMGISHVDASTYGTVYFTADTAGNTSDFIFRHGETSGYSEKFRIKSNGNVGIGTTDPTAKLDVNGGTGVSSGISIRSGVSNRGNIYYDGVQSLVIHGSSAPAGNDLKTLEFATGGTTPSTRMVITRDGSVGIGTTEPSNILDVNGSPRFRGESVVTGSTKKHVFKGYVTGQGSVSHTITGLGSESSHLVVCVTNHFGLLSYGCTLMAFATQSPNFTTSEIHRTDTSLGGNWSISKPANGSLTITKNAGSYVGGGNYLVMVYSTN